MKTKRTLFLISGALCLALLALVAFGVWGASPSSAAYLKAAPLGMLQEDPMPALPEADCSLSGSLRTCHLWALPGSLSLPGAPVEIWGFAASAEGPASLPGPVIRANTGETLEIVLHNEVPGQTIALAFPGQGDLLQDLEGVSTGNVRTYTFAPTLPGAFLYEAGLTFDGPRQVAMGLAGPLIVSDPAAVAAWDQEIVLVFNEIDPAFNANPTSYSMLKYQAKYWVVNGLSYPQTGWIGVDDNTTVLMRYLNAGSQPYTIGLLGLDQEVIAWDGEALPFPTKGVTLSLAPGQSLEALVHIPQTVDGTLFPLYPGNLAQHNNNARLSNNRLAFGGILTFLKVTGTGTGSDLGPVASSVSLTPAKTNGTEPVTLSATLTDADANVTHYRYSIDSLSPATEVEIDTPAPSVTISQLISTSELALLSGGQHTVYISGKDANGYWGATGSAVLTFDNAGPQILGLGLTPNPTNGSQGVILSGTADDRATGASNVVAAVYSLDGQAWQPMTFSPTGSPFAGLSALISHELMGALAEGLHSVEVRAQDELGNWSLTNGATTLRLDKTGPAVLSVNLNPNLIDLSKPLPPTVRLTAVIEDPTAAGLASTLVNAEAFIDTQDLPGKGFALYPSDGLFDETNEDVYYNIPGSAFANLSAGEHRVLVVGKDKAGNWGEAGWASINIVANVVDTTGPVVSNVVATPNPVTISQGTVTLTATVTDSQSNVAGAVWFQGTKPPKRLDYMSSVDGAFDELVEDVRTTIDISKWKAGTYQISVRAYDTAGNWGQIVTINLVVNR